MTQEMPGAAGAPKALPPFAVWPVVGIARAPLAERAFLAAET